MILGPARIAWPCLRNPPAGEQVAEDAEARVRLAGELVRSEWRVASGEWRVNAASRDDGPSGECRVTRAGLVGSRQRLATRHSPLATLKARPLVDHEPPPMGRAGDRVGVVGGKAEEAPRRLRLVDPGRGDLIVAVGAFHEDHPAPGQQACRHAVQGLADRSHGAADHSLDLAGIIRPQLVGVDLDVLQAELGADLGQELGPSSAGLGQDHPRLRPGDLQRDARQARPGAHVDQRRGEVQEPQDQQAVDVVLQHHVLEVVDPRQVEPDVRRAEELMIAPEPVELRAIQANPAVIQDGFEGVASGSQGAAS